MPEKIRDGSIPIDWIYMIMALGEPDESKAAWRVMKAWKEHLRKEYQTEGKAVRYEKTCECTKGLENRTD